MDEWWPTNDEDNESKVLNDNWGFDVDTTQNLVFFYNIYSNGDRVPLYTDQCKGCTCKDEGISSDFEIVSLANCFAAGTVKAHG